MTTNSSPSPVLAQLPPNLTRNYYEVRREDVEQQGGTVTPWYRLNEWERQAVNTEVDGFRRAVRRAEEEQALVAEREASVAAAAAPGIDYATAESVAHGEPLVVEGCTCPDCKVLDARDRLLQALAERQAAEDRAAESCSCCRCAVLGALKAVLQQSARPSYEAVKLGLGPSEVELPRLAAFPLSFCRWGIPLSREERTLLDNVPPKTPGMMLFTAGIDFDILTGRAPRGPYAPTAPLTAETDSQVAERFRAAWAKWEAEGKPLEVLPKEATRARPDLLQWYEEMVAEDRPGAVEGTWTLDIALAPSWLTRITGKA